MAPFSHQSIELTACLTHIIPTLNFLLKTGVDDRFSAQ